MYTSVDVGSTGAAQDSHLVFISSMSVQEASYNKRPCRHDYHKVPRQPPVEDRYLDENSEQASRREMQHERQVEPGCEQPTAGGSLQNIGGYQPDKRPEEPVTTILERLLDSSRLRGYKVIAAM